MRKLIYLFNPISGTTKKDALLKKIETAIHSQGFHFELLSTNAAGEYNWLKEKIEHENITDLVIIGGDGSINHVTGVLKGCPVRFGIIPVGSGNGLAYSAGIPKKIDKALEIIFNGNSKKIDAFLLNNQYACMLSGLGF